MTRIEVVKGHPEPPILEAKVKLKDNSGVSGVESAESHSGRWLIGLAQREPYTPYAAGRAVQPNKAQISTLIGPPKVSSISCGLHDAFCAILEFGKVARS